MNALLPNVQKHTQQQLNSAWLLAATQAIRDMPTPTKQMKPLCEDVNCSCHRRQNDDSTSSKKEWTFVPAPPGKQVETFFGTSSIVSSHDQDTLIDLPHSTPFQPPMSWIAPHNLVLGEVTKMKDQKVTEISILEVRICSDHLETSNGQKMRTWDPKSIRIGDFMGETPVRMSCSCIHSTEHSSETSLTLSTSTSSKTTKTTKATKTTTNLKPKALYIAARKEAAKIEYPGLKGTALIMKLISEFNSLDADTKASYEKQAVEASSTKSLSSSSTTASTASTTASTTASASSTSSSTTPINATNVTASSVPIKSTRLPCDEQYYIGAKVIALLRHSKTKNKTMALIDKQRGLRRLEQKLGRLHMGQERMQSVLTAERSGGEKELFSDVSLPIWPLLELGLCGGMLRVGLTNKVKFVGWSVIDVEVASTIGNHHSLYDHIQNSVEYHNPSASDNMASVLDLDPRFSMLLNTNSYATNRTGGGSSKRSSRSSSESGNSSHETGNSSSSSSSSNESSKESSSNRSGSSNESSKESSTERRKEGGCVRSGSNSSKLFDSFNYYDQVNVAQSRAWSVNRIKMGNDEMKKGRFEQALQWYNQAITIDATCEHGYIARGAAHANRKRYAKAIADFEHALFLDPDVKNGEEYLDNVRETLKAEEKKKVALRNTSSGSGSASKKSTRLWPGDGRKSKKRKKN